TYAIHLPSGENRASPSDAGVFEKEKGLRSPTSGRIQMSCEWELSRPYARNFPSGDQSRGHTRLLESSSFSSAPVPLVNFWLIVLTPSRLEAKATFVPSRENTGDPALVYAFQKTRVYVCEENERRLPKKSMKAFDG